MEIVWVEEHGIMEGKKTEREKYVYDGSWDGRIGNSGDLNGVNWGLRMG